jgi:hypothetical protein
VPVGPGWARAFPIVLRRAARVCTRGQRARNRSLGVGSVRLALELAGIAGRRGQRGRLAEDSEWGFDGMNPAAEVGTVLEHPAGQKRERGFLEHLVPQDAELTAKIGNVFKLHHFVVAQGIVGTFAEILDGRFKSGTHGSFPRRKE